MTERFSGVDVGKVYFNKRDLDPKQSISNG